MGQLKFEREFREKLNEREIEPKSSSWEALSAKLESEDKRRNPLFWWVGIAATIIGGILILGSFFNEPQPNNLEIVNVPVEKLEQNENGIQQNPSEKVKPEAIAFEEKNELIETPTSKKTSKGSEKQKPLIRDAKSSVAAVNTGTSVKEPIHESENNISEVPKLSQTMPETIAEVGLNERSGHIVEKEVDALLAEANFQLTTNREQQVSSEKITANALLWDVEMEMEASFREKVFEVVKEGFFKARTAVVNRNY